MCHLVKDNLGVVLSVPLERHKLVEEISSADVLQNNGEVVVRLENVFASHNVGVANGLENLHLVAKRSFAQLLVEGKLVLVHNLGRVLGAVASVKAQPHFGKRPAAQRLAALVHCRGAVGLAKRIVNVLLGPAALVDKRHKAALDRRGGLLGGGAALDSQTQLAAVLELGGVALANLLAVDESAVGALVAHHDAAHVARAVVLHKEHAVRPADLLVLGKAVVACRRASKRVLAVHQLNGGQIQSGVDGYEQPVGRSLVLVRHGGD